MTVNIGSNLVGEKMKRAESIDNKLIRESAEHLIGQQASATELWIPGSLEPTDDAPPAAFKTAMRALAGGVAVITVGRGEQRTGFTATSVVSLSAEPPRLMFGISTASSSWNSLEEGGAFAVNLLSASDTDVANRFAGRGGEKGLARYEGVEWVERKTGIETLSSALAGFDCEIEEVFLRYDHAIVIGRVKEAWLGPAAQAEALVYWQGSFGKFCDAVSKA